MQAPSFRSEDEEAQHFLSVLRDGTDAEKIVARERLAAIFARRGLLEEVVELLERNVQAGARSPELFARLSQAYRRVGRDDLAEAALAEARRLQAAAAPAPTHRVIPFPTAERVGGAAPRPAAPASPTAPTPTDGAVPAASSLTAPTPTPAARRGAGPARLLLVLTVVAALIVVPVLGLALLVVNPLALYLEGQAPGPTVDVGAGAPARLKVAPGASSSWYLRAGRSVAGLWATPGLELTVEQELAGLGRRIGVTPPRAQSWGETITVVERRGQDRTTEETILPATLQAPASLPPAGTVLAGRIVGQVMAPRMNDGSQFSTATQTLDVPVELVVVSTPELWLDRFTSSVEMYAQEDRWLLVTIGALLGWCLLAGVGAVLLQQRRPPA